MRIEGIIWISNMQSAVLVIGLNCLGIRWFSDHVITNIQNFSICSSDSEDMIFLTDICKT